MKRRFKIAATESASYPTSYASQQGLSGLFIDHLIEQSVESALLYNEFSVLKIHDHRNYFDTIHPIYPFLDQDEFERKSLDLKLHQILEADSSFAALYYTVLALGCQHNGGGSFEPGQGQAWQLFRFSLGKVASMLVLTPSLTSLQALTAMVHDQVKDD
ncbi:hypothetical protein TGAM01_v210552 [Trichoderma gamsii]|uniref:Transcription factor domain-containing protein n=1 Tax=Trichoderma gamsii TaxID=398673 RepID=A0A2P4Z8I8_9HYPO|nr:hypothetical protein TGAM01_v210552 [Trichoderma gamsii]PON20594.1 hypothetical protein TGAM01_v210552 [Trichoderma gamsii]